MKKLFLILLFLITSKGFAQSYESIELKASNILLDLSNNKSLSQRDFEELRSILNDAIISKDLETKYQTKLQDVDSLNNQLQFFLAEFDKISTDSAFVLFNQWYLQFCNAFYNYAEEKFFSSNKVKLLLFSASVSCACTLEMCRNQTIDIINFAKENGYDYWIVDSYENNQLQIEYETLFAPSVLVFDENNKVLSKIEYDEKMITKLSEFLVNHNNKKLRG